MVLTLLFNALLVDPLPERQVEGDEQPRILCGCRHRLSLDPPWTSTEPLPTGIPLWKILF